MTANYSTTNNVVSFFCFRLLGRSGFNPRSSHTKGSKMVLDTSLLNTQNYKVPINGKVEQF